MMTNTVSINSSEHTEISTLNIVAGASVALTCAYIPFLLMFAASALIGWGSDGNPLANTSLGNTLPSMIGLATVAIGIPLAIDMRKRSVKHIAVTTAILFSVLGVLVSFTM